MRKRCKGKFICRACGSEIIPENFDKKTRIHCVSEQFYNFILIEYKNALIFCIFLLLKNKAFLQFNNLILLN